MALEVTRQMASTSIPDWLTAVGTIVAALGTVGTLIAALWQISRERKARQRLERQAEQRVRRAQAEHISAWVASSAPWVAPAAPASVPEQSVGEELGPTRIALLNRSEEPVYQAVASVVFVQGAGPRTAKEARYEHRATLTVIPPGRYYTDVAPFPYVMAARPGVELAFTDHAGVHWVRAANGDLTQVDAAPVDHYELDRPLDWRTPTIGDG
jgi:hypothetical protein